MRAKFFKNEGNSNEMKKLFDSLRQAENGTYSVEYDRRFNDIWISFEDNSVLIAPIHKGYEVIEKKFDDDGNELSEDKKTFDTIEEVKDYLMDAFDVQVVESVYGDSDSIYKFLKENELFTEEELDLVTKGWGFNEDTFDRICEVRYGDDARSLIKDITSNK